MEGPVHDNYLVLSKCRNPACTTPPHQYLAAIENSLQMEIRKHAAKLYENWIICEDPACTNRTRRIPLELVNSFPVCRLCGKGLMYREYRNPDYYYQLKFYAFMFNLKSVCTRSPAYLYSRSTLLDSDIRVTKDHKMGSFCIYKQQKRISILCAGEFMESAILHNIRCLSFSVIYKCRRVPSYDLTSLSSKVDREYRYAGDLVHTDFKLNMKA